MSEGWSILLWIFSLSFLASGLKNITTYGAYYLIAAIMCFPLIPFGFRPGSRFNGVIKVFRIIVAVICIMMAGLMKTAR